MMANMEPYRKWFWVILQAFVLLPTIDMKDSYVVNRKIDVPQFEKPIGNHTFHVGREAVLGCSVINLGRHKVGWLRAEDQTVLTMEERPVLGSRYSVNRDDPTTWKLRIKPLKAEDRGCYMCQINTQPNMKWQIGCIDVYVPPDIISDDTSSDVSAQELDNVTLVCKATGHPPPKVTWRREDNEQMLLKKVGGREFYKVDSYVDSILPLWRVDRRQMGAFFCIASNDVPPAVSKRITLRVNFPPTVIVPNQLLGAPLGTDVNLECTVEAYPNTINYWLKNRGEMLLDGPKYTISEERSSYKVSMKLVIRHFSRADIGTYNCVSTNSLGKSEGTLRLYEIKVYPSLQSEAEVNVGVPPTVIVPNQLLGAPLGTDVNLECTVEAYPNTINYWLKNRGEMLLDGPKYTISEERSSYKVSMKLVIRHFSRADIGTYNCVSTNSLGKSEGTLRLYEIKVYPSLQSEAEVNVGGLTEGAVKQKSLQNKANIICLNVRIIFIINIIKITVNNIIS